MTAGELSAYFKLWGFNKSMIEREICEAFEVFYRVLPTLVGSGSM